jgi:hypothetical protein
MPPTRHDAGHGRRLGPLALAAALERKAMPPLTAQIEVPVGQTDPAAFRVILRLTNQAGDTIAVLNPDLGKPTAAMRWPWSSDSYRVSLLISFHYLSMSVTDKAGRKLPQQAVQSMATPVRLPDLHLAPGTFLELPIPIGDFYELGSGRTYDVMIEYGDRDRKVTARTLMTIPQQDDRTR